MASYNIIVRHVYTTKTYNNDFHVQKVHAFEHFVDETRHNPIKCYNWFPYTYQLNRYYHKRGLI